MIINEQDCVEFREGLNIPQFTSSSEISQPDLCKLIYQAKHFPRFGDIEGVSSQLDPSVWVEKLHGTGAWDPDTTV